MTTDTLSGTRPKVVWSVAGSDSGGGAGLQADQRAIEAFGGHACSVVAAITAQNSVAVRQVEPVSVSVLDAQLAALAEDLPPAAIKTGILGNAGNMQLLAGWIDRLRQANPALPLVVDPVLRASTGAAFDNQTVLHSYRTLLLPRATLITPNRAEAAALLGCAPLQDAAAVERAAADLLALGCRAVVITGGDAGGEQSQDYAVTPQASGWLSLTRVPTAHQHGTGCVLASTAATALAHGFVEIEAIILAKMATTQALRHGYPAGQGAGPVRAGADFAQNGQNLPTLRRTGVDPHLSFAPLTDAELGLYAVVDSAAWVQRVLAAGVKTVQLRIKDASQPNLRAEVRASIAATRAAGAQLFINDHWALAMEEGAYGVHLGQEDLDCADLSAIAAAGLRLGLSSHSYWEVCRAWGLRPSYLACGPIHPTQAKRMPWLAQGNDNLAYWCALLPLPVVAIAGMDATRATQAMQCGAAGVAVISAITGAADPEAEISRLQQALQAGQALPRWAAPAWPRPTLQPVF